MLPRASPWSGYYFTLSAFQRLRRSFSSRWLHLYLMMLRAVESSPGASPAASCLTPSHTAHCPLPASRSWNTGPFQPAPWAPLPPFKSGRFPSVLCPLGSWLSGTSLTIWAAAGLFFLPCILQVPSFRALTTVFVHWLVHRLESSIPENLRLKQDR